jgi:F-type H+-transporting ATPase subunit epsilon
MRFELVSPERRVAVTDDARTVAIPGMDGDLTAGADHEPTITSLRPGIVTVEGAGGTQRYAVTGGFAEIGASVSVLAERAVPVEDMTQQVFDDWVGQARASQKAVQDRAAQGDGDDGAVDSAAKLVADMVAIGGHVGLDPKQPNL